MSDTIGRIEEVIGKGRIKQGEYLDKHTIAKKGGPAELYVEADTIDDLVKIVKAARALQVPVFVLGGGSFAAIPEKGMSGLIVKNNCRRFDKMSVRGTIRENHVGVHEVMVSAESGVNMNQLVRFTIEEGLEGLEYQLGLPGTVGGAIVTNAKYKSPKVSPKYVKDFLHSIRILADTGEIQVYTKDLPYFVNMDDELQETKDVILSVVFKLAPTDKKILWERGEEAGEYRSGYEQRRKGNTV